MEICFATNNMHKLREIREILGDDFTVLSLKDIGCNEELPETHDTLEGNSEEKAAYVYNKYNINCFADDTGLEVAALNGAPGVYSARYAGENPSFDDNMNLLLKNMEGEENRTACFRTIITLIIDGKVNQFEGKVDGEILSEKSGKEGFGYDPIFKALGHEKSFAELTADEKNAISHRGRAVQKLGEFLKNQ